MALGVDDDAKDVNTVRHAPLEGGERMEEDVTGRGRRRHDRHPKNGSP
jgi:hypothetical protein